MLHCMRFWSIFLKQKPPTQPFLVSLFLTFTFLTDHKNIFLIGWSPYLTVQNPSTNQVFTKWKVVLSLNRTNDNVLVKETIRSNRQFNSYRFIRDQRQVFCSNFLWKKTYLKAIQWNWNHLSSQFFSLVWTGTKTAVKQRELATKNPFSIAKKTHISGGLLTEQDADEEQRDGADTVHRHQVLRRAVPDETRSTSQRTPHRSRSKCDPHGSLRNTARISSVRSLWLFGLLCLLVCLFVCFLFADFVFRLWRFRPPNERHFTIETSAHVFFGV